MQSVYPHNDDDRHRVFDDAHKISAIQHASWPSQHYIAYTNGEIMNNIGLPNSRQTDYVPGGQVHYGADYEQSPVYAPSPVSTGHDRYQNYIPDDTDLRQVVLTSFPEGLPDGHKVEGLRFSEGWRDQNGQLIGGKFWELSSYCIPSQYDQADHYNAGLTSLPESTARQQQYDTPHNFQSSQPHALTTIPQPHGFDGHADSHSLQTHCRSNSLSYGRGGDTQLEPAASVMPHHYVNAHPHRQGALDNVPAPAYRNPAPSPAHVPSFASHYAPHPEGRPDAYERSPSAHRHSRDSQSMFVPQSPSPPPMRRGSNDSTPDGYSPPSQTRLEKSPSRRQDGPLGSPLSNQAVIKVGSKRSAEKKQTLACLFCRERKIACGRPAEGSADHTCNQCARRQFKCEYPKESRRGQHKRGRRKAHDVNDAN